VIVVEKKKQFTAMYPLVLHIRAAEQKRLRRPRLDKSRSKNYPFSPALQTAAAVRELFVLRSVYAPDVYVIVLRVIFLFPFFTARIRSIAQRVRTRINNYCDYCICTAPFVKWPKLRNTTILQAVRNIVLRTIRQTS